MDFTGLLDPQKEHSIRLLNSIYKNGISLDSSDTGVGKTFCAAWMAKQLNCPVVVICPIAVLHTWKEILAKFGIENPILINYDLLVRGNTEYLDYTLKLFHSTPEWWKSNGVNVHFRKDSLIIIDEIHKCRGQKSLCGDLVTALKNKRYKIHGLTATLATSVADLKHTGYLFNLHTGKDWSNWCEESGGTKTRYGTISMDGDQSLARAGMKRIYSNLHTYQQVCSRMRRADFKGLFPENRFITDVFDLGSNNEKLQRVYDTMQYELELLDERAQNYSAHVFAIIMKARRHSEILKVPKMVEWIEESFEEGISPVLFVNFSDTIAATANRLDSPKYKNLIGFLHGDQTRPERIEDIHEFQINRKRIFIANNKAGNLGIGLHDLTGEFPRHSLMNPTWSAIDFIQSCGRIYRVGGKSPCIQRFFYANVEIERRMAGRMKNRTGNLEYLNEGDITDSDLIYKFDLND